MPNIYVNDITIYYEEHGCGEPLLLIAGCATDCASWQLQLETFSKNYRVIIFDNRGVGRSEVVAGKCTTEIMANDASALLKALKIESAHVLGHSLGGAIAQHLALNHPQQVKSLVLACSFAKASQLVKHVEEISLDLLQIPNKGLNLYIRYILPWLFTERFFEDDKKVSAAIEAFVEYPYKQSAEGNRSHVNAVSSHDTTNRLSEINVPTLILAAKQDRLVSIAQASELSNNIPNSKIGILEESAHACLLESEEDFNRAVIAFLKTQTKDKKAS